MFIPHLAPKGWEASFYLTKLKLIHHCLSPVGDVTIPPTHQWCIFMFICLYFCKPSIMLLHISINLSPLSLFVAVIKLVTQLAICFFLFNTKLWLYKPHWKLGRTLHWIHLSIFPFYFCLDSAMLWWLVFISPPLPLWNILCVPEWEGQTADRLVEGGYEKVLETHWLLTRTTGVSSLQMDTQVGSQVGKEGGEGLCQFLSCFVCVCVYMCWVCVCGRTHNIWTMVHWHVRGEIHQWSYTAPYWLSAAPYGSNTIDFVRLIISLSISVDSLMSTDGRCPFGLFPY